MATFETSWWDEEKTILYFFVGTGWTWNDVNENVRKGRILAQSVTHPIAVIVDLRQMTLPPPESIYRMSGIAAGRPENIHFTVYVTDSLAVRLLFHNFCRIYPAYAAPYRLARTVHEAVRQIDQWKGGGHKPPTMSPDV